MQPIPSARVTVLMAAALFASAALARAESGASLASVPDATAPAAVTGSSDSAASQFTADGQRLLFFSLAANLVPNDTNRAFDVFLRDLVAGTTTLVSVNRGGTASGNGDSTGTSITPDGRYVVFESTAQNLVAESVNGAGDIYVRDLQSGTTKLVSMAGGGVGGQSRSSNASITPDGRYVAFESLSPYLSPGGAAADTNQTTDVFVRDLQTATTTIVSHPWNKPASTGNGASRGAVISADGRYVAFSSTATNLARGINNTVSSEEVFVRDMQLATNTWISTNAYAFKSRLVPSAPARTLAYNPVLSADGQFVAYKYGVTSSGLSLILRHDVGAGTSILVAINAIGTGSPLGDLAGPVMSASGRFIAWEGKTNVTLSTSGTQIYLWDATDGSVTRASVALNPLDAASASSSTPTLSPDGGFLAFLSFATNLTADVVDGSAQLYLRELPSGATKLISARRTDGSGAGGLDGSRPLISDDGSKVAFHSVSPDLVADDSNQAFDVFVRDVTAGTSTLVSAHAPALTPATPFGYSQANAAGLNADATRLAFVSVAPNLTPSDHNGLPDVFVRDLANSTTALVSASADGTASGNGLSRDPMISGDGRWVAFGSFATNLVADAADNNLQEDVFLRDTQSGVTRALSVIADGTATGNKDSSKPSLSANGQWVAFQSRASDLVAGDLNNASDVFVRNVQANETQLVSRSAANNATASKTSELPVISPDARWVVFSSKAGDLVDPPVSLSFYAFFARDLTSQTNRIFADFGALAQGNTNALPAVISGDSSVAIFPWRLGKDLYLHEFTGAQTTLLCAECNSPQVSADGSRVVYVNAPPGGTANIYLRDRQANTNRLVSVSTDNVTGGNGNSSQPLISPDGRFVVFQSAASNLVGNDTNTWSDVFLRDLTLGGTILVSVNPAGAPANRLSVPVAMGGDGRSVSFASYANDLVDRDFNDTKDLFALRLNYGDLDHDALPDDWEVAYFGNLAQDGSGDFDGDGATDRGEFTAGTNPASDASVLRALTVQNVATGQTTVLWSAVDGRKYRVQFKDSVEAPQWNDLPGGDVTATGGQASAFDPDTTGVEQRYYRVLLVTP